MYLIKVQILRAHVQQHLLQRPRSCHGMCRYGICVSPSSKANINIELLFPISGHVKPPEKRQLKVQLKLQKSDEWPTDSEVDGMVRKECADDLTRWDGEDDLKGALANMLRSQFFKLSQSSDASAGMC